MSSGDRFEYVATVETLKDSPPRLTFKQFPLIDISDRHLEHVLLAAAADLERLLTEEFVAPADDPAKLRWEIVQRDHHPHTFEWDGKKVTYR